MGVLEPVTDGTQRVLHRQGLPKDAAARAQAQESQRRRPGKSDATWIIETLPQGFQRRRMLIADLLTA